MAVHFLHTSDWHLGQLFYNYSRHYEHEQFLAWLLKQIKQKQPHALLIAGDIFDVINPSSQAQKQLYQFLADAHELAPHMQTLMIAGNHDSGYRIEQVEPLLEKFNAKAVGIIHWNADKTLNTERLILPIYDASEKIVAWCVALPFLRPAEITGFNEHTSDNQSAIEYVHQSLIAETQRRKTPEQALIVMSHAHMQGGEESDSERRIVIGNQEALSTDLFTDAIDYVALGHLHKPQKVQHAHIRYSGSPIPLSFSEINYQHQVIEAWIDPTLNEQRFRYEVLAIPRSIQLHRINGELEQVMQQLKALPQGEINDSEQREYVDVEYHSTTPPPLDLRQQIELALPANRYRLLRICRKHTSQHADDAQHSKIDLAPPTPEQLFSTLWDKMGFEHDDVVEHDFLTLLHDAEQLQQQQKTGL
ncbi:MAG: exonuclease SbcCD subunit D C-terminal domain-containing protein [Acinetobacter populi]|jgi:exonuclease SbcD|uniref:exonuclease SbcCD subunit D n=1 Tax=Acinetobacter populi TaxID=1582270 RepID=UPI002354DEB5|nr:exonuclease SbcCD subunit D [Acinetobacter populi]MCH4246249.1 exonuclease SbcCD subunit D C-terminal domain-containing protein [Acinetobacter populi]